jgi:ATP-dependent Lon protease
MQHENQLLDMPLLPLRDVVIFPHMVIPLFVGREKSISALEAAMAAGKQIFLVSQKDATDDDPQLDSLYAIGTVSTILQLLKLPDGTVKVLVEGGFRASIDSVSDTGQHLMATVSEIAPPRLRGNESEVLARTLINQFDQYVKLSRKVAPEVLTTVSAIEEPSRLADTIATHLSLKVDEKQQLA